MFIWKSNFEYILSIMILQTLITPIEIVRQSTFRNFNALKQMFQSILRYAKASKEGCRTGVTKK